MGRNLAGDHGLDGSQSGFATGPQVALAQPTRFMAGITSDGQEADTMATRKLGAVAELRAVVTIGALVGALAASPGAVSASTGSDRDRDDDGLRNRW